MPEAAESLKQLGRTTERKILRKGLRAGAKIIKAAAQADAPSRTGLMARKIKVRAGKSGKGRISVNVGVGAKDFTGKAFYAAFVLFGHRVGSRKLGDSRKIVPANNFLERAFESSGESAKEAAVATWGELIEQAAANQGNA